MITALPTVTVIALATLALVVYIGLGFLPRPSHAAALWSGAFAVAMVGSYVWLTYEVSSSSLARAVGAGLVLAPMPLLWSGLRAYRRRRPYVWVAVAFLFSVPLVLLLASPFDLFGVAFRGAFTLMAVFAALTFVELVRLGPRLRDEALPLIGISLLFIAFAALFIANGVLVAIGEVGNADGTQFLRTLNTIGMAVYIVCALTTTLLLTVRADDTAISPRNTFERTARGRLDRARSRGDDWWSVLDIRLDDPDDLRRASSTAAFNAVTRKLMRDVDESFPADADIERVNPTRFVVLLPRPQGAVRALLAELLERVSTEEDGQAVPLRLTASVGWVPATAGDYDFTVLLQRASDAAELAASQGGDRWERVHGQER